MEKTAGKYEKVQGIKEEIETQKDRDLKLKNGEELYIYDYREISSTISAMIYKESERIKSTTTKIDQNQMYSNYTDKSCKKYNNSKRELLLGDVTRSMGCFKPGDSSIILGSIHYNDGESGVSSAERLTRVEEVNDALDYDEHGNMVLNAVLVDHNDEVKSKVIHRMGDYRIPSKNESKTSISEKVKRVDEITTVAAKKVFLTEDKEEALRYAFIFAALRGYNVRNVIGACWAQEMSLRWILAQKGFRQFRKKPGIYLDIEAAAIGEEKEVLSNDEEVHMISDNPIINDNETNTEKNNFADLIDAQVNDYLLSTTKSSSTLFDSLLGSCCPSLTTTKKKSFFDPTLKQNPDDFIRYLIETGDYSAEIFRENFDAIISYRSSKRNIIEDAFQISARNGNHLLFDRINK